MNQEITKKQKCIVMRNGAEIWVEEEVANQLNQVLSNLVSSKFIIIGERTLNTADITSILPAKDMEDITRRKNGQYQCGYGHWHEKGDQCSHGTNGLDKYPLYK